MQVKLFHISQPQLQMLCKIPEYSIYQLIASQGKLCPLFPPVIAKSMADKLLLKKKNDAYGFHEENTGV
jgi:hypothetical protein